MLEVYLVLVWSIIVVGVIGIVYLGLGGRALWGTRERPERIVGYRVQLRELESGPTGLEPEHPRLPPAVVERYEPTGQYLLRFEAPVVWHGRTETQARVSPRAVGYPVSLAAGIFRRHVRVAGRFGSGEAFLGELRRL